MRFFEKDGKWFHEKVLEFDVQYYMIHIIQSLSSWFKVAGLKIAKYFISFLSHPQTRVSSFVDSSVWLKKIEFAAPECSS